MVHPSWIKVGGVALEIVEGTHDADLESIRQACAVRVKSMWRKGDRVRLVNTRNVLLDGAEGRVEKVNTKSISVVLDNGARYNVNPELLEKLVREGAHA